MGISGAGPSGRGRDGLAVATARGIETGWQIFGIYRIDPRDWPFLKSVLSPESSGWTDPGLRTGLRTYWNIGLRLCRGLSTGRTKDQPKRDSTRRNSRKFTQTQSVLSGSRQQGKAKQSKEEIFNC